MDPRTIGQILSNPEWLRQTYGEERPIQGAPSPHPSTFVPSPPAYPYQQAAAPGPTQAVATRPESPVVEVRGTIAYVARYRAEYFNDGDQQGMMSLAQSVIMNDTGTEPGETPPPWFPDVQFWIQSFERIDPHAAQREELKRLHQAKIEQEQIRIREAEFLEQQRRADALLTTDERLYGPASVIRAGVAARVAAERENGWEPGPIPSSRPDWVADIFRDIFERLDQLGDRLDALGGRDGGAGGAGAAVRADDDDHRHADPGGGPSEGGEPPGERPGRGGGADLDARGAAQDHRAGAHDAAAGDLQPPGGADAPAGPGDGSGGAQRRTPAKRT